MKEQNPFYSVEPEFVSVSKRKFDRFVRQYPRPLRKHLTMICTPPVVSYNDFRLAAKWPYSDVAHYWVEDDESQNTYKICTNYRKLFKSRIGNMSKFKVGDRVIGNQKADARYNFTKQGWVGVVTAIFADNRFEAKDKNIKFGESGYALECECFDLFAPPRKICANFRELFKNRREI